MKINKLLIGSFGKFKDYELNLEDGFNVLYGKNEDGKSTLMAFIKMMFYNKFERGRDIDKNLRRKYQPWDGSMMHGVVEFDCSGVPFRLQKNIGVTPAGDDVKLINVATGQTVPLGKNEELGKRFFGLDLAGFERSAFIGNIGNFTTNGSSDEVAEKLMSNMLLSGDESISQQQVQNRLNEAIEDLESKSGKKGLLVDAQNELDALRREKAEIETREKDQKVLREEADQLEKQLEEQKVIQKLLQCIEDKSKFDRLTSLLVKINSNRELEKSLEKEKFTIQEIKAALKEWELLLEEAEKTRGSLEKLTEPAEKEGSKGGILIPIHEEEFNKLKELNVREEALSGLLKRMDEAFLPTLTLYLKSQQDCQKAETALKQSAERLGQLKKSHEEYLSLGEIKNGKVKEKEDTVNKLNTLTLQQETNRKLRDQNIRFMEEKISIVGKQPTCVKRKMHWILSGAIALLSIFLIPVIGPFSILGLLAACGLFIYSLVIHRKNKKIIIPDGEPELNLKQELTKLKNQQEEALRQEAEESESFKKQISKLSNEIAALEVQLIPLKEKDGAYQEEGNRFIDLGSVKDRARSFLEARQEAFSKEKDYLRTAIEPLKMMEDIGVTLLLSEELRVEECTSCRSRLEEAQKAIAFNLEELLTAKSCHSIHEYEEKYLKYSSDSKNQKAIYDMESKYQLQSNSFISAVSQYEVSSSYEEARNLFYKLKSQINNVEINENEILNIANGMGYNAPSLEYLESEKEKLVPSIEFWSKNGGESLHLQNLLDRKNVLSEENLESRFLDLQRKIKTPDKNLGQIDAEIKDKEKEILEKSQYLESLQCALKFMKEASDEMRQSFGPELNHKASEVFNDLTNGKYGSMLVNKEYDIAIQSGIHYREWQYLSNGTIDQAYLALRLAITELVSDKNTILPLFLDDVLMQYDDERLQAALDFLSRYSFNKGKGFQLLLFSCHNHIVDCARTYGSKIVNI